MTKVPHDVCPWWLGYFLLNPLRRLGQDPERIVGPYVAEGMTVFEPGPGMGYFTLALARRVGARGRVVAADVQDRMLAALRRRAVRAGVSERIETRLVAGDDTGLAGLDGQVDFVLAFAVVHELPDAWRFLAGSFAALKPGGRMLVAEPSGRVPATEFEETLAKALAAGLRVESRPAIRSSHAAVLVRPTGAT